MNSHARPGDENGEPAEDPGSGDDGEDDGTRDTLQARLAAYVENHPGERADRVRDRLDADPDAFHEALDAVVEAGRVETRSGVDDGTATYLFSESTVRYWDEERTRPLFERTRELLAGMYVAMFPGCTTRDVAQAPRSRSEDRAALRELRRRGLVQTHWSLHGRVYEPSDLLVAWARDVLHVKTYEHTPAGVAQAFRDTLDPDQDTAKQADETGDAGSPARETDRE